MTNKELDCFSEGYILGRNKVGNLKPLQVTENGIYYPADYKCGGFNKVEVNVSTQNNLIDKLPTWGEVIINEEYSIKIKHSDEIEDDNNYNIATYYSNIPYLYMLSKYWTFYFCVYKNNQLVFGNKVKTHSSRQWSWSMWNSDTPWLNVYNGHNETKLISLSAKKTGIQQGLSGVAIQLVYQFDTFFYRYNIDGGIDEETHSIGNGSTGNSITGTSRMNFYADTDYNKRTQEMIAYGLAANNIKELECRIYTA